MQEYVKNGYVPAGPMKAREADMIPTGSSSNDDYIEKQIDIMTRLLTQMCDRYAIARIRIQLWNLEAERRQSLPHTSH